MEVYFSVQEVPYILDIICSRYSKFGEDCSKSLSLSRQEIGTNLSAKLYQYTMCHGAWHIWLERPSS
jgi:hypothetical protein